MIKNFWSRKIVRMIAQSKYSKRAVISVLLTIIIDTGTREKLRSNVSKRGNKGRFSEEEAITMGLEDYYRSGPQRRAGMEAEGSA